MSLEKLSKEFHCGERLRKVAAVGDFLAIYLIHFRKYNSMTARSKIKTRSSLFVILILIGLFALLMLDGRLGVILEKLYSPYAAFIAVIMLVEYVALKGADRSAMYRRELEDARNKRREDLLAFKKIETGLENLRASIDTNGDAPDPSRVSVDPNAREKIDQMLESLRSRI